MPELNGKIGLIGPGLQIALRLPPEVGAPPSKVLHLPALLDTGSTGTMIDPVALAQLDARPGGRGTITWATSGGSSIRPREFTVQVGLANAGGEVVWHEVVVAELSIRASGYDVVVGWDILSRCVLVCDGPKGTFTLTY